jgi:hypothetical protein
MNAWFEATSWGTVIPIMIIRATSLKVKLLDGRWRHLDSDSCRIRQTFEGAKQAMIDLLLLERNQMLNRLRQQDEKIEKYRNLSQ